jgi:hypothetical protein
MRRRIFAASFLVLAVLLVVTVTPVAAVTNPYLFAFMGDCGFDGYAPALKTVKIEWRDSLGDLKSMQSVTSDSSGAFTSKCEPEEQIEAGDTIKLTVGTHIHTVTVPRLTATIDRVTDTVAGHAPANSTIQIYLYSYAGKFASPTLSVSNPSSDGSGAYSADFLTLHGVDIKGYDYATAAWYDGQQDGFSRQIVAEGMTAFVNRSLITLYGNPGTLTSLTLKSGSTVLSQVSGSIFEGNNGFDWFDSNGERVRAVAGDAVIGSFASDADMVLPTISATVSKSTSKVTANCGLGSGFGVRVLVERRDLSKSAIRNGVTGASGFVANFGSAPAYSIASGDKVFVYCKLATGDIAARSFTVV